MEQLAISGRRRAVYLVVALFPFSYAGAATIDCAKARSPAEIIICEDPAVYGLDEKLAQQYVLALSHSNDDAALRREQMAWLRVRDRCADKECVTRVHHERISALKVAAGRQADGGICKEMRQLFLTGSFRKYSIDLDDADGNDTGRFIYRFRFDGGRRPARLEALCGGGTGSLCEHTLTLPNSKKLEFTLPATHRLLQFNDRVYIVNGVIIDGAGRVTTSDYTVHELRPQNLQPVCNEF